MRVRGWGLRGKKGRNRAWHEACESPRRDLRGVWDAGSIIPTRIKNCPLHFEWCPFLCGHAKTSHASAACSHRADNELCPLPRTSTPRITPKAIIIPSGAANRGSVEDEQTLALGALLDLWKNGYLKKMGCAAPPFLQATLSQAGCSWKLS